MQKAVDFHISKYLLNNNSNKSLHSAYKSGQKTETSLIRMENYIMYVR